MKVMTETDDGFEVRGAILELRGPGDFFGTKQSGVPDFRLADMAADFEVLEQARDDAAEMTAGADFWTEASYARLRDMLQKEQFFKGSLLD